MGLRVIAGGVAIMLGLPAIVYGGFVGLLFGVGVVAAGIVVLSRGLRSHAAGGSPGSGERTTAAATAAPDETKAPMVEPMPPIDVDAAADLPEPVIACPQCFFLGIKSASVGDGIWPGGGELIHQVCPRCHFRGQPLEFGTAADYANALEAVNREYRAAKRDGAGAGAAARSE